MVQDAVGFEQAKHTTGRKRHTAVDTLGLVLRVLVTAARVPALAANQSSTASSKWEKRSHAWI
jgi:hypothetical protein